MSEGGGGNVVRELLVRLGFDVQAQSFLKAELSVEVIKEALEKVVEIAREAVEALLGVAETGKKLDELSHQTGVATDTLQELAYGAQFSGLSVEELAVAMGHLSRTGVKDLKKGVLDVSEQFSHMADGGEKNLIALQKFGRAGPRLINWLNEAKDSMREWKDEAEALGYIMDKDTIQAGKEFEDGLIRTKAALKGVSFLVGGPIIKALKGASRGMVEWVKANKEFLKQIGERLAGVAKFAVGNVGLIVIALGSLAGAFLLTQTAAIASGLAAAAAWVVALAPILLAAGGIAILALAFEDFIYFLQGKDSVIGRFVQYFKDEFGTLPQFCKDVWAWIESIFTGGIDKVAGILGGGTDKVTGKTRGALGGWSPSGDLEKSWNFFKGATNFFPNSFPGGGASPNASAASSSDVSAPVGTGTVLTANIVVNTHPDMDTQDVAQEMVTQLQNAWSAVNP